MVASSVFTWQGELSVLSASGMALAATGRMQQNARAMRAWVLAGVPFWLLHDILIASPVAIADATSLFIGVGQLACEPLAQRRRRPIVSATYAHTAPFARLPRPFDSAQGGKAGNADLPFNLRQCSERQS